MVGRASGQLARATSVIVAVLMMATSYVLADVAPAAAQDTPGQGGIEFGSTKPGLRVLDGELDREIGGVRVFERWDSVFPDAEERLHLAEGRTLLVSIFPRRTDGSLISWADIASAAPGSELHDDIVRWAARLSPYQDQVYVTFNHEPEAAKNTPLGSAAEFQAAWQNTMAVFADEGLATLGRLLIVTSPAFEYPVADRRAFDQWYPGDAWVDAVGGDAYNFASCRPAEPTSWSSLSQLIEGQRAWGAANPGVELMLSEFASVADEADPTRRATWLTDAATTLADPAYGQFSLASYFYEFDPLNPGCDYLTRSHTDTQAFYDMANDPAFGGTPPGAPAAPTRCDSTITGNTVEVAWRPSFQAAGYELTRLIDGAAPENVSTGPQLSFSEASVPDSSYEVAAISADGTLSPAQACTEPDPAPAPLQPPPTCEWARDEGFRRHGYFPRRMVPPI